MQKQLQMFWALVAIAVASLVTPIQAMASDVAGEMLHLTDSGIGYGAIVVFAITYLLVVAEEFTHLRKSKPVIIAAGTVWGMIGWVYMNHGMSHTVHAAVRHNLYNQWQPPVQPLLEA